MQLFICNLLRWILFLMCIFFLSPDHTEHTTSWDQRRASKQQEESEAKGVCLSLHLIPMLLKHSGRHHPAAVWERACLFIVAMPLFIWSVSNTANKDVENNDMSLIKSTRNNRLNVLRPQGENNKRHLSRFSLCLHIRYCIFTA